MEKAKTDFHDVARDRSLFERFFESLKAYAASSEEAKAWIAPRTRSSELGASPKFKIIKFYG